MQLIKLPIPLTLLCLTLALTGGCGLSPDEDDGGPSQGEGGSGGGSQDGGGGGDGGPGGNGEGGGGGSGVGGGSEEPWHCTSKNWSAEPRDEGGYSVTTDHYQLDLEVDSKERAEELGRMAEAAWLAFSAYFESEPDLDTDERLAVAFFSSEERFQATLSAIGANVSDIGGYYSPTTRTAYLYEQPNPYYTHILYIHEMAHQFHRLARKVNQNLPFWYGEGLAEYLSRHDWDGQCIRLGVVPMLSWEDLPSKALESVSTSGLDVTGIMSGKAEASRAVSWAIVGYLERGEGGAKADAFATYRSLMDVGDPVGPSVFEELVGPISAFEDGVMNWLPSAQEPLSPIYTEWMHVAPGTVRSLATGLLSLARVKQSHGLFEVSVTKTSSGGHAGVLAGFTDKDNYVAYLVGENRQLSEFKKANGKVDWEMLGKTVAPNDDGSFSWTVTHTGSETLVEVNGYSFSAAAGFQPVSGPAAFDADANFTGIKWE